MSTSREVRRRIWEPEGLRTALSIAGLDPSGGAGLVADVRAFDSAGVYGTAAVATVTYQSSRGVAGRFDVPPGAVRSQVETLVADRMPDATKTGALGRAEVVKEVGRLVTEYRLGPLVVDPVLRSTSGGPLVDEPGVDALRKALIPVSAVVTPNVEEASALCGFRIFDVDDAKVAALRLHEMGALTVVITGLRVGGESMDLFFDGEEYEAYSTPWVEGAPVHGTGCLFSATIAAVLATGEDLVSALERGREAVRTGMEGAVHFGGGLAFANPYAPISLEPDRTSPRVASKREGRK